VLKGGKDSIQRFGLQHPRRYIWRLRNTRKQIWRPGNKKTEMQGKKLHCQTRKKACDAPAVKSSRHKKPAIRNMNKMCNDSSSEYDIADGKNICADSDSDDT
jgi:hypothetical protein